ncbi:Auxin response factor 17-like protein [Drosera capensis]
MMAVDHRRRPAPLPPPPSEQRRNEVDPKIWKACAGNSVEVPRINSRVLYFPQGHIEHASESIDLDSFSSDLVFSVPCRVVEVRLLADENTDEVFAAIRLDPIPSSNNSAGICVVNGINETREDEDEDEEDENGVVSFAKVLTQSDANNGGGFSVPRFCAELIFPPLKYDVDPPVQNIGVRDVHGKVWQFRHIYRGVPRRHLLTTGWSKLVNSKKLIAGDSVVFMRNEGNGELAVGVRRALKSSVLGNFAARFAAHLGTLGVGRIMVDEGVKVGEKERGFSRSGKGKVAPEAVVEAATRAASRLPFEVVYYPRVGYANFVVDVDKVRKAMSTVSWSAGMRVRMSMETEDSSRMTWFQGTVALLKIPDSGLWRGSPWRMLQVTWDEPEVLQNMERVSPWEVEYVTPTPTLADIFPQPKKLKGSHTGEFPIPMIGFGNPLVGPFGSSQLNYLTFPTGMQGARQNTTDVSSLSNLINNGASLSSAVDYSQHTVASKNEEVSTELNIGSPLSQSSPDSASSADTFDLRTRSASTRKTIQLFGQSILVDTPLATQEVYPGKGDGTRVLKGVKVHPISLDFET